jgi:hypothetical protein
MVRAFLENILAAIGISVASIMVLISGDNHHHRNSGLEFGTLSSSNTSSSLLQPSNVQPNPLIYRRLEYLHLPSKI